MRLASKGTTGYFIIHLNHVGTCFDDAICFYTPGNAIASLDMYFLVNNNSTVDFSERTTDYNVQIADRKTYHFAEREIPLCPHFC